MYPNYIVESVTFIYGKNGSEHRTIDIYHDFDEANARLKKLVMERIDNPPLLMDGMDAAETTFLFLMEEDDDEPAIELNRINFFEKP